MHYPPPSRPRESRQRVISAVALVGALFAIAVVAAVLALAATYVLSFSPPLMMLVLAAGVAVVVGALL